MSRRLFFKSLMLLGVSFSLPAGANQLQKSRLLQLSPIAGFQYHQGEEIWAKLHQGAALQLTREPENKYDPRAVRIDFNGQKLGYIPRIDNAAVSQLLDRGEQVQAYIANLKVSEDPWERVEVEVRWIM